MESMFVERDVSIPTDDGLKLKADVFRPKDGNPVPVIMSHGPYGKGVPYQVGYAASWKWLIDKHPGILPGSSRKYLTWETVDPKIWVSWGYVCVRVDSRGAGRTFGYLEVFSPQETKDFYDAIEWAAAQPWSNGSVGLSGISYYAINQWQVACLQPPHLKAMIPWEGAADVYRDIARHGGIQSNRFLSIWYPRQIIPIQHGNSGAVLDPWMQQSASGPEELSQEQLESNRSDPVNDFLTRPLDDEWYKSRSVKWDKVTVPFLSAASWAGFGLHARGNFEAFTQAASKQKWLECHPGRHEEWFYLDEPMAMQKRFLDHFLKGEDNGWDKEPPVLMHLRRPFSVEFPLRKADSWPLSNTEWTNIYLTGSNNGLNWTKSTERSSVTFQALGTPAVFLSPPLEQETEITGPLAEKIFASSSTADMDLFITFQAFAPDGNEVDFQGTIDPRTPLAQGWLRASHRKLDHTRSKPYRPYHTHDEIQPLEPGQIYELDVEIWPTHIILPAGYTLGLQIGGKDFERSPLPDASDDPLVNRGSGPFLHDSLEDRPLNVFGGETTIYTGGEQSSAVMVPIVRS